MSDSQITSTPTGKADVVTPEGPKPKVARGKSAPRGVHVVYNGDGVPTAAFSAEVGALRAANALRGSTKFVEYGADF